MLDMPRTVETVELLAPATGRDYTQTPSYELPVLRTARKLTEIHNISGLIVARRNVQ